MFTQVIEAIKDITGPRFYFIALLGFFSFLAVTFKDEIKSYQFNPKELMTCSNEAGLVSKLVTIKAKNENIGGYIIYLYQPRTDSYYKKLVSTDIPFIKENAFYKSIPLNAQKYLNYILIDRESAYVDGSEGPRAMELTNEYGAEYIYVYNIFMKETIGEIIFTFKSKPTQQQLEELDKELKNSKYYII